METVLKQTLKMKLCTMAIPAAVYRSPPDGSLTSGRCKHEIELENLVLNFCTEVFICEDNVFYLTKAEEVNTMSTGEDEPLPVLNGRLRPRKSTTNTPSPQNLNTRKSEGKQAQDRPKRTSAQSKASPDQHNDLAAKSDTSPTLHSLCPYCDRTFATRQTASKHARRIHLSTSKQDNFIRCLHCNHSDAESHAIIKHMVDSHPNQYFACLDCFTRFHSTAELAEHKLNVCEKQKPPYRNKLRQKSSAATKKNLKRHSADDKSDSSNESTQYTDERVFNGIVISCELKSSEVHDAVDIEDKITTNLILPPSKTLANATMEKNAVIVLDDLQWNKRIPPNFSFHNTDADQILSRLGVVHRSPRVGESKEDLIRMMDEPNEKFEKCFDTSFYSKVAKNVQDNLSKYLDGSFSYNPNKDNTIKTRKSKMSVVINTAEGFPILLAYEQFSRNLYGGFLPKPVAPKYKWKWDSNENDKITVMLLDQTKRDSHVNNCIITLVSGLDIWTQLRMRAKFEEIFKTTPTAKKTVKQNIISMELKEILESRDIPTTSTQIVQYSENPVVSREGFELPSYLGLSPRTTKCNLQPAVLSGEWVRPRCYVCCACGEQNGDSRTLSAHITSQHPNAQVQHYEIVGETLLSADILKHLYVPPSQMSNRTRPPRGFRDCTKCKKSITLEDLHQHMLDCAGDTPTVRRKCRYRPFGVRRRRTRLPDNTIRKKMRKDIRSRHRQKGNLRPRIRTEVGDAETIRKMIADLPAKRNRITPSNVLRPRRNIIKVIKTIKLRSSEGTKANKACVPKNLIKVTKTDATNKQNDSDDSLDEDDQPLKLSVKRTSTRSSDAKDAGPSRITIKRRKIKKQLKKTDSKMKPYRSEPYKIPPDQTNPPNQTNPVNQTIPHNSIIPPCVASLYNNEAYSNMYPSQPPAIWMAAKLCYNAQPLQSNGTMEQTIYSIPTLEQPIMMQPRRWSLNPDRASYLEEHCDFRQTIRPTPRYQSLNFLPVEQEQPNNHDNKQLNSKEHTSTQGKPNLRAKPLNKLVTESELYYPQDKKHDPSANPREDQLADEQVQHYAVANQHMLNTHMAIEYAQLAQGPAYNFQQDYPQHIQNQNILNHVHPPEEQGHNFQLAHYYTQYMQFPNQSEFSQMSQEHRHNLQLAQDYPQYIHLKNQPELFPQSHEQAEYIPMTKKLSEPNVQLPKEQAHSVQMTEEPSDPHVQLSNEQAHSVQITEELSKPNVQLSKEQASNVQMTKKVFEPNVQLPIEQAHSIQITEELSKPNVQPPKEQACSVQMIEELSKSNVQPLKEQAQNVQIIEELSEPNVQLLKEQAQNVQITEVLSEPNVQVPKEQAYSVQITEELSKQNVQLLKEQAQNIQITGELSEPNVQLPKEQATSVQMTEKLSKPNVQLLKEQAQNVQITEVLSEPKVQPLQEKAHNVQITDEISVANVHLLNEQAHNVQITEELSEPNVQLPIEQAHSVQTTEELSKPKVQLPKEQAHNVQMIEELSEPNVQLPKEQAHNVQMTEELPEPNVQRPKEEAHNIQSVQEQAKYNQLPSEYVNHIPMTKEFEEYDQLTKEGGKHIITKDRINENIDVRSASPSNVRQHSNRDEYDMQNGKNRPAERGDNSNKNYNMTSVSNMPLKHSIASLTTETEPCDLSVSYKHPDLLHQNMNITIKHTQEDNRQEFENEALPEELHKPPLQSHPIDLKKVDPPILDLSQKRGSLLSVEEQTVEEQTVEEQTVEEQMEMKNETDKSKLNKTRKGLNDCIAMLLTKKGLWLDHASNTCGEDVNVECAAIETRSSLVEQPTDRLLAEQNNYLIPGPVSDNSVNLTPAQVFSRSALSENFRCESYPGTEIERNSINNLTLPSTSADRALVSQSSIQNEDKCEFTRIRSSSETEYKPACQKAHPSWTEPTQSNDANPCQILQNMRHNSYDGVSIHGEAERFLKIRQSETVNSLNQIQKESKTKIIGHTDGDLQERYTKNFTQETSNQQSKVNRSKEGEVNVPNTFENVKIPAPQGTLSPTSRRTRRKPTKNDPILFMPQSTLNYRRSPQLKTNVDKQTPNFRPGVEDPNMHLISAHYLPGSSSVDPLSLNSPQDPRIPRELYKSSLESSETVANVVENHKDGSLNKAAKKPAETRAEKSKRLRRYSIELASAQSKIANYEAMMMQSYREYWNKHILNTPSSSGEPPRWHKMISEEYLKQFHRSNVHCEKSNELVHHHASSLMFGSLNQNAIGTLHVNPIGEPSGTQSSRFQNAHTESSKNYPGSNVDCIAKDEERNKQKNTDQAYKTNTPTSNALDNNSHKHGIRQGSGEHFTRSSPYQHNFVDTSHEKKRTSDDNSLHHAHRNAVSYEIPAVPYSDNTYRAMPLVAPIPHVINTEDTPLDLSCDRISREERAHELYKRSLDAFKTPCGLSTKIVQDAEPIVPRTHRNFTEQLHNVPPNPRFTGYETTIDEPHEDLQLPANGGSLGEAGINKVVHETNASKNHGHGHGLIPSNTTQTHSSGPNLSENSLYNSSYNSLSNIEMNTTIKPQDNGNNIASGQLLSHPPEYNLHSLRQSQGYNSTISRQESMQDKTFCENKKITRVSSTQVSPIVPERRSSWVEIESVNPVVGNVDQHPNIEMDDHTTSVNNTTENAMSCPKYQATDTKSVGKGHSQMCSQDILEEEDEDVVLNRDPDTARKIAMLPKELVEILGTMPKDHRIQLLNILPQYVSQHVLSVRKEIENNISSATVPHQISDASQIENKQDTANNLIINTNISPSSIIPKKRHSPSQTTGELNFNEARQTIPVLHPSQMIMPTLSQVPPTVYDDNLANNAQSIQNPHQNNDSGSYIKAPFTETMSQTLLNKDSEDTEINVVDLSEPEITNKSAVASTSAGNVIFSSQTQQTLIPTPITKSKKSNEQTASLRAVRIKTTSARKSLTDENNKSKMKSKIQTEMLIRTPSDQNSTEGNNVSNENKAIGGKEYETSVIPNPTSMVLYNEHIVHNTPTDANQSNQEHNNFLGSVKSATFSGGGKHNDAVTVQQSHFAESLNNNAIKVVSSTITGPSAMDIRGNDFTTESNRAYELETMEKISQITTEETVSRSSQINEVKETQSTIFLQHNKHQLNSNTDASQGESFSDSKISCKSRSKDLSSNDEKHTEDDSEDEVSLAVLKQKQIRQTKLPKVGNISAKLEYEEKKHQAKQSRKNRKKKKTKSSKIIQKHKLLGDCIDNVKESSEIELSFDDTEVKADQNELIAKSISVNTTGIDKDKTTNHYEFDVNKENNVTENIIKITEDDHIILPENNQSENQLDNRSIDKNIEECTNEHNFNMDMNLIPENSASQETKDSTTLEATYKTEIKENRIIVKGSLSNQKRKINTSKSDICLDDQHLRNKYLAESENDSDACSIHDFNISTSDTNETPDINMSKSKPENLNLNKISEVSTKLSTYETPQDNGVSDFQLCSDVPDITAPLRRSRRGKSTNVDSNCSEDSGHVVDVEYIDQRTPLTMKQLILSRVEKEKNQYIDHNIFEKSCNAEVVHLINSEVTDVSRTKKRKMIIKKSSKSTRKSKKLKTRHYHDNDEDTSDVSIILSASESNTTMLQELSKAESKNKDIESCTEDVQNEVISENTTGLSKNYKEKICNAFGHGTSDLQELDVAEKRKLNLTEITDLVSCKSKKSKNHCKEKASSDFESDDEKVLSNSKNQVANDKHQILDKDESMRYTINSPTNILNKEDSDDTPLKIRSGVNTESNTETNKAGIIVETRTTCYNRPVSNRRHRSSSATFKDNADYDPYNIDFEDMLEPMKPIIKKKVKNIYITNVKHLDKLNNKSDDIQLIDANSTPLDASKKDTRINIANESDSDSSKSDVPLQKYVDEKTCESEVKNNNKKTPNDLIEHKGKMDEESFKPKTDCVQLNSDHPSKSSQNEEKSTNFKLKVKISQSGKGKKSTKRVKKCHSLLGDEISKKDDSLNMSNNISIKQTRQKRQRRKKKSHRTLATPNIDNANSVSKEEDIQLRSDKFMENFGFYSERIPRKSNLLASKKIAETYSMISNESDDNYFRHKEKPIKKPTHDNKTNDNKKKSEISSDVNVSQEAKNDETNLNVQPIESQIDVVENVTSNEPDVMPTDDGDLDSVTAKNILESEEIRNLENALFSSFKEAADANAATSCYLNFQPSNSLQSIRQDVDPNVSTMQAQEDKQKNCDQPESTNKQIMSKPNKQAGVKDKMYPDIEEIDMLEDKFDKIKRKRRSQAVAAKQVQSVVESCISVKSRKPTERKRTPKNTKKNYQSTQVPTKGALKGFDGIKISIPTQDLNMPLNVSPPRQQKKRRKAASKRRKERSESESSGTEFCDKDKPVSDKDIYEFKDNEDAESFELRPSTVMDRFRSLHVKNKCKNKEKDKGTGEVEKEKHKERAKEKEKKAEIKEIELINDETQKSKKRKDMEYDKRPKKYIMLAEGRCIANNSQKEFSYPETKLDIKTKREKFNKKAYFTNKLDRVDINDGSARPEKSLSETTRNRDTAFVEEVDIAKAGTSGFIPNRDDESDYESELSSPEGEFIFYMSNDVNCICPSDNDSDDSDVERGCGRPNCIYKNINADKNAAIGNIFKNNAVRCEKTDVKDLEAPRPDLDQLFDSLFESNSELSRNQNNDATESIEDSLAPWPSRPPIADAEIIRKSKSFASHHELHISSSNKQEFHPIYTSNKSDTSRFSEQSNATSRHDPMSLTKSLVSIKNKPDETYTTTCSETSGLLTLDVHMSKSEAIQSFITDKPKEKLQLGLGAKDCPKIYFAESNKGESLAKNKANEKLMAKSQVLAMKTVLPDQPTRYKSDDKFKTNKSVPLKRRHKRYIRPPANKTEAETESCNESAVSKYLKRLTSEEAAHIEIYSMVSAQGTQTGDSRRNSTSNFEDLTEYKTDDELDMRGIPKRCIRLQKLNVFELNQMCKSSIGIQTDKSISSKSYDSQDETDHDVYDDGINEDDDCTAKEPKCNTKNNDISTESGITPWKDVNSFVTPTLKPTVDKHSPRKSDEGISMSHDYSAEAFDQSSFDDTGVARQRARRKCAVGKQNVLAEHWSSESEFDGVPPRRTSADSVVASVSRKKKSKKKEGHHSGGKRGNRHSSKNGSKSLWERGASGAVSDDSDACPGPSRAPHGPKIRARPAHHYWSSDGEDAPDPQPQHGWIVGDSHKKLVTMLAHAKGRKRSIGDRRNLLD